MKQITSITSQGVHYTDEAGNPRFIDFATCQQHNIENIKAGMSERWTDEEEQFWQTAKYVGRRHTWSEPPNIVFYTSPPTKIEFPIKDDIYRILSEIKQAGWRTNDGE